MRRVMTTPLFLFLYATSVSLVFPIILYFGFAARQRKPTFDSIRVHRIDVIEPDGTPRMIIADRAEYPGSFFHKEEVTRSDRRDSAGMLFLNDEGTEDGGLIYGGMNSGGKKSSFSHLSFDQYDQDQTVVFGTALFPDGSKNAGIELNDAPLQALTPELYRRAARIKAMPHGEERRIAWQTFTATYPSLIPRVSLARSEDGSVGLLMRDMSGRERLRICVRASGEPIVQLLGPNGDVQRELSIAQKGKR